MTEFDVLDGMQDGVMRRAIEAASLADRNHKDYLVVKSERRSFHACPADWITPAAWETVVRVSPSSDGVRTVSRLDGSGQPCGVKTAP